MTRRIALLLVLLAFSGCARESLTAPSTGTCDWRDQQVTAYVAEHCGGDVTHGCLGPHWLSNGMGVFLDEWNAGTTYRITDYPSRWCYYGASLRGRETFVTTNRMDP